MAQWQLIVYMGHDPLTGDKLYERKTVEATGKRDAQAKANRWELELHDGQLTGEGGTCAQLFDEWIQHRKRNWSPSNLRETQRIVDTYLRRPLGAQDATRVTTRNLDVLYGTLVERGGACQHRPCPRPTSCGIDGHPIRCQRVACVRSWVCPTHDGACAGWTPCDESPCKHGGPLTVASVARIHNAVRSAFEQAVIWGWRRDNPAERANPGAGPRPTSPSLRPTESSSRAPHVPARPRHRGARRRPPGTRPSAPPTPSGCRRADPEHRRPRCRRVAMRGRRSTPGGCGHPRPEPGQLHLGPLRVERSARKAGRLVSPGPPDAYADADASKGRRVAGDTVPV
jgi:hypothetical protein